MYPDLKGKVAVVTGAGRPKGIGRATARRLVEEGARVVIADLGSDSELVSQDVVGVSPDLGAVAEEFGSSDGEVLAVPTDVSDPADVKALMRQAVDRFSRIDIVVCCAATSADGDLAPDDISAELFNRVLGVNLTGTFLCAQAGAQHMVEEGEGGKIITIGSRASRRGNPNLIAYSASKFGVLGLTQALALAYAPHDIRVNCVCPGSVATDMADADFGRHALRVNRSADELRAEAIAASPLGRLTKPEDLANAIVWLASSESDHVTGQSVDVNGGTWLT